MVHRLLNVWLYTASNRTIRRIIWRLTSYHRCWGKLMIYSLILDNTRDLGAVIVMMVLVHLLLKLLDMLIGYNFSETITAHLFWFRGCKSLLILVEEISGPTTTSHCRSFWSISTAISCPCWDKHWRLQLFKRWIAIVSRNQCLTTI